MEGKTEAELISFSELRKQSWESREGKVTRVHRTEFWIGENRTQREVQRSAKREY